MWSVIIYKDSKCSCISKVTSTQLRSSALDSKSYISLTSTKSVDSIETADSSSEEVDGVYILFISSSISSSDSLDGRIMELFRLVFELNDLSNFRSLKTPVFFTSLLALNQLLIEAEFGGLLMKLFGIGEASSLQSLSSDFLPDFILGEWVQPLPSDQQLIPCSVTIVSVA